MFLQVERKKELVSKLLYDLTISYDSTTNSYYVGIPSNIILHVDGNVLFKAESPMIIESPVLHLNPPKSTTTRIIDSFKKLIWRNDNGN